jgi:hypothetical protein
METQVPPGEPRYVAGPHPLSGVGEGVYLGILTVTAPGAATNLRLDGVESVAVVGRDGPSQVVGFQFELPRGGQRTVVARFELPGRRGILRVEPSARVPTIAWRSADLKWRDLSQRLLTYRP